MQFTVGCNWLNLGGDRLSVGFLGFVELWVNWNLMLLSCSHLQSQVSLTRDIVLTSSKDWSGESERAQDIVIYIEVF